MRKLLLLLISAAFFSCSTQKLEEQAKIDTFFDLEGTLDIVITDLVEKRARLHKKTTVNNEVEDVSLSFNSVEEWKSQLELFYEADINKVGLGNNYRTETLQAFDGIEKTIHSAVNNKQFVKSIETSVRDGKLFTVRILASDENFVYSIENEFILYFNHFKKKLALDHFTINTKEEMLFKKGLELKVEAQVVVD